MLLEKLTVWKAGSLVREVTFRAGLNLILDKPTNTKTQSGNNVGKTTTLRLIDYCLGSDGTDIWQDPEFKKVNQDVYDFLHNGAPAKIELVLLSHAGTRHSFSRRFASAKTKDKGNFVIDGVPQTTLKEYQGQVKFVLFGNNTDKPSGRQLIPKFMRTSPERMNKTLKFLGSFASEAEYSSIHLFLFGFLNVEVLEARPVLFRKKKQLSRDLQAATRERKEGEIDQLILHLREEILVLQQSARLKSEVPAISARADKISEIRVRAGQKAAILSTLQGEISSIDLAIRDFGNEFENVDERVVRQVYEDAQAFVPELHKKWEDLSDFVRALRSRKREFLESQRADLQRQATHHDEALQELKRLESDQLGAFTAAPEFVEALAVREELQSKLIRLGSLERSAEIIKTLRDQIAAVDSALEDAAKQIEAGKAALTERVKVFNQYFSKLSKDLYGEQYLLHFDESEPGAISFHLAAVGANVGAGKKMSQTAAFDLAYIEFLVKAQLPFPLFVCHDGLEAIHNNQLGALLASAENSSGQLVVATLRDKLPKLQDGLIASASILELSQDDKFFSL